MAKEPKLFAEIRASKARAEKAAKHAPPVPVGPIMSASVVTPDVPYAPHNYIAKTLDECTTVAHCEELLAHAKQHGYSEDGQTVKLIRAKLTELGGAGDRPAKTAAELRADKKAATKALDDFDKAIGVTAKARKRGGRR